MEQIIKRDLLKHKELLGQTKGELDAFKMARAHEIKKKRYYSSLIGGEKYNDDSLRAAMKDIAINIRHLSDKADLAKQKMDHHSLIIDTLTKNLEAQNEGLAFLARYRKEHGSGD